MNKCVRVCLRVCVFVSACLCVFMGVPEGVWLVNGASAGEGKSGI